MRRVLVATLFALSLVLLISPSGFANDVPLPEINLADDTVLVSEDAGQITLDVTLSASSTLTVTTGYETRSQTAVAGEDFLTATGTLTFTPSITLQTASIALLDDALPEADETFLFVLSEPVSATLGTYPTATVTIADDGDPYLVYLPMVARRWPPIPYDPVLNVIANADGDGSYWVSWQEQPTQLATTYILEEATDDAFSLGVRQACSTSSLGCNVSGRVAGTYYYRVKGTNVWADSGWSSVQSVAVLLPDTPVLHAIENEDGDGNYTVDWSDAARATSYIVHEDDNAEFSSPEQVYSGSASSWLASNRPQGTHYYRVQASGGTGTSEWSNPQSVSVLGLGTPTLDDINNQDGDGNYTVSWQAAARATGYQLQEDDNAAFSSPATVYTGSGLSWSAVNRAVGTYYYRVMATGATGNSDWSNTRSTEVEPPPPPPMSGANVVCNQIGSTQICASVSSGSPSQYSTVTVYGRLLVNGVGQSGQTMSTTWHYKTTTSTCSGSTNASGMAQCSRSIGRATKGYRVNVDVEIGGHTVTTWFTPQ